MQTDNFGALRIAAAWTVIVSHQYPLMGYKEPLVAGQTLGTLAVYIFFTISGFLVAQSWQRDPNVVHFLCKRALRIFPGLAAVTLACMLVLGPIYSEHAPYDYLTHLSTWGYLQNAFLVPDYRLPGVFHENPFGNAINGSLWTIPYEAHWYLIAAAAGTLGLMRWPWGVAIVWSAMVLYAHIHSSAQTTERLFGLEFGCFFVAGWLLHLLREQWMARGWGWFSSAAAIGTLLIAGGAPQLAIMVMLPVMTVWLGVQSYPVARRAGRFGDPSYGMYLYAWPVQQALIATGIGTSVAYGIGLSTALTVVLAYASWYAVESPALSLKQGMLSTPNVPPPNVASSSHRCESLTGA